MTVMRRRTSQERRCLAAVGRRDGAPPSQLRCEGMRYLDYGEHRLFRRPLSRLRHGVAGNRFGIIPPLVLRPVQPVDGVSVLEIVGEIDAKGIAQPLAALTSKGDSCTAGSWGAPTSAGAAKVAAASRADRASRNGRKGRGVEACIWVWVTGDFERSPPPGGGSGLLTCGRPAGLASEGDEFYG